ncbi:MAG: ABC transporter ATP-binding protein [Acidimicrobiales bacterium]
MTPSAPAAIEVDELVIRYGDLVAVDGASFVAPTAAITALLGPNGAGKTSTIEAIEGYRSPTAGRLSVLGLDPRRDHARLVERVGIMLQGGGIYRSIRVEDAVRLFAAYYDDPLDPDELIQRVGLGDRRRSTWRQLSGGEQQRLSLALALVGRPSLVVLDEPGAGLDVTGRRLVHQVIRELAADGVTVLLATHDLAEAEALADHVVIIDHGRVVAAGTTDQLRSGSGGADTIRFAAAPGIDVAALGSHLGADVAEEAPGEYVVTGAADPRAVASLTAWLADHQLPLGDLRAGRQRLEDVFVRLTSEESVAVSPDPAEGSRRSRRRGRSTP